MVHLYYKEPGIGALCLFGYPDIITFTGSQINLNKNTVINGNLTVNGTLSYAASQTITHYAPVDGDINDFRIGVPVFMSGDVYKYKEGEGWVLSTNEDTEDCICSVILNGTHKTFVGVITRIDEEKRCITFATHGDFLFYVDDSSSYEIGDVVLYDGSILDEDATLTLKLQQSIVGKVSAVIDENTLVIFKS